MAEEEIGVRIAAKTAGLSDGLNQATAGIKGAVTQMQGHFSGLSSAVSNLSAPFLALGGILAGGAIFKGALDETRKWNDEAIKMSRSLGITTQEASILNLAIGDIYSSTEEYLHAAGMMTRQINTGGEGFKKLGLDIRDANGQLKPTGPLMQEVITKLNGITQGTARNAAGMAVFGRGWGEAKELLLLNNEVMEEARKKAEKLNLIVGGDSVAAQLKYKAAMNDFQDVMLGVKVAVGKELLPVLTDLGQFLAEVLPPTITGVSAAMKGIITTFAVVKFVVETVAVAFASSVMAMVGAAQNGSDAINKFMRGDFSGALESSKRAMQVYNNEMAAGREEIASGWEKLGERMAQIWDKKPTGATKVGSQGTEGYDPDKGKDKGDERLKQWQTQLRILQDANAKMQMEDGKYYEMTLTEERNFWQKKLDMAGLSEKERMALTIKVKDLERGIRKENFEANLAELHAAEAAAVNDLQIKRDLVLKEVALYRDGTKEQIEAKQKLAAVDLEIVKQHQALNMLMVSAERDHQLNLLALDEQAAQHRFDMGESSQAQLLEQQRAFATQRFQIEENEIIEEMASQEMTLEKQKEFDNRKLVLFEEYQLKVKGLKNQAAIEEKNTLAGMMAPITEAWNTALMGMLGGTMRFSTGLKTVWQGIGKAIDQMVAKMVTDWIAAEFKKLAVTTMLKMKELFLHLATEKGKAVATVASATVGASAAAVEGGARAASSAAAIPVYGWAIAIGAGLAVFAGIKSMMSGLNSARGGWGNIPQDQLAQVHKGEMVIPENYAEGLRGLIEGGGAGQAQQQPMQVTIHATDAQSVARLFLNNGPALAKAIQAHARNNGMRTA